MTTKATNNGGGRTYKLNAQRKADYLRRRELGDGIREAAKAIQVSHVTIYDAFKRDPEFKQADEDTQAYVIEEVEGLLLMACRRAALRGNVAPLVFYLTNRAPDRWADRRNLGITGPDGGPLTIDIRDAIDREIAELAREVAGLAPPSQTSTTSPPLEETVLE